jgi:RNA recognition motif-containing protein
MTSIFVAKLDFNATDEQLKSLFEQHGRVNRVTMANEAEAEAAIEALDNSEVNGRPIAVKKADDRGASKPAGDRPSFDRGPRPDNRQRDDNRGDSSDFKSDYKKIEDKPARPVFNPDEVNPIKTERKKEKDMKPAAGKEGAKKTKMEAYRKSGKGNRFFDEDDDEDYDYDAFRRNSGWEGDDEEE